MFQERGKSLTFDVDALAGYLRGYAGGDSPENDAEIEQLAKQFVGVVDRLGELGAPVRNFLGDEEFVLALDDDPVADIPIDDSASSEVLSALSELRDTGRALAKCGCPISRCLSDGHFVIRAVR